MANGCTNSFWSGRKSKEGVSYSNGKIVTFNDLSILLEYAHWPQQATTNFVTLANLMQSISLGNFECWGVWCCSLQQCMCCFLNAASHPEELGSTDSFIDVVCKWNLLRANMFWWFGCLECPAKQQIPLLRVRPLLFNLSVHRRFEKLRIGLSRQFHHQIFVAANAKTIPPANLNSFWTIVVPRLQDFQHAACVQGASLINRSQSSKLLGLAMMAAQRLATWTKCRDNQEGNCQKIRSSTAQHASSVARLPSVKAGRSSSTKIRGWNHFKWAFSMLPYFPSSC